MQKKLLLYSLLIVLSAFNMGTLAKTALAQSQDQTTKYNGIVTKITTQGHPEFGEEYQELEVALNPDKSVTVINNPQMEAHTITYKTGDRVVLQKFDMGQNSAETYIITDFQRTGFLTALFVVFVVVALLVGKKHGLYSILGMAFSFLVLFKFVLPQIVAGKNPVLITVLAALLIIPVTFYLSHGFNTKTHIAIGSTVVTLILTALLTGFSVNAARLTGFASEEARFLQIANQNINMKGILLAGIIIGFLGVLDDVTVSQASIVAQLRKSKRNYEVGQLYKDAMTVGRDHITSMINTLVLVYAGAAMPLMLLFVNTPQPALEVINMEILADEIIRTLVGSIGLILAVPLTTFIASNVPETIELAKKNN
jgi:uncharacterized membrane protein